MWQKAVDSLFVTRMLNDVTTYFNLYDYLKIKAKAVKTGKIPIKNEQEFWGRTLGETYKSYYPVEKRLNDGDVLAFSNFFLTDWVPKTPGAIWTKEGDTLAHSHRDETQIIKIQDKHYPVFHPNAKERKLKGGYGSIRVNPSENDAQNFVLMNLVSPELWNIDSGIPVIVSKSVYEEFTRKSKNGAAWVENAEGVLYLNKKLPVKKIISAAIGHEVSARLESELTKMPDLPSCYVYFPTTLTTKIVQNDTHPLTTAWTMFRSENNMYGLTYWQFDPYDRGAFKEVSTCLVEYVRNFNGKEIITDFDGLIPRLDAKVPLNKNPMEKNLSELERIVKELDPKDLWKR
jgi:hypothetical protein